MLVPQLKRHPTRVCTLLRRSKWDTILGTNQSLLLNHWWDFRHEVREIPAQAFLNSCADGEEWTAASQEVWSDGSAQLQMRTLHIPLLSVVRGASSPMEDDSKY